MKRTGFHYNIEAEVTFTGAELFTLYRTMEASLDWKCNEAASFGGWLYGEINGAGFSDEVRALRKGDTFEDTLNAVARLPKVTLTLNGRKVDALCKACEDPPEARHLYAPLRKILDEIADESDRLNPRPEGN